jgi:predicted component of type VI protein secretion system
MPPQLVALSEGPNIPLDKPILLLGRHEECDIQLASRKVSRKHCCIAQVQDYLVVRDLGSTNGIRINGVRVMEGKLQAGDELTIGNHQFRVEWNSEAVPLAALPRPANAGATMQEPAANGLDSSDEPIPIAKPVRPPPGGLPPALGGLPPLQTPASNAAASPPDHEAPSQILPENIELAQSKPDARPKSHE